MRKNFIFALLIIFFLGCSQKPNLANPQILELEFDQNATILQDFSATYTKDKDEFFEKYFKVWEEEKPYKKELKKLKNSVFWGLNYAKNSNLRFDKFGKNYDDFYLEQIVSNANIDALATLWLPAITTKNTLLRNIPSSSEIYANPAKPGEGYPFDYAANSALGIAYPLLVSHFSSDKKWAFVQNDAVWGWIKSDDIKFLDEDEIFRYKNSNFIAILVENSDILNQNGEIISSARIGTILPFDKRYDGNFSGILPTKQRYFIDDKNATIFPAPLDDKIAKTTINSLLGQSYGWGGVDLLRDCSLLTKDFLATFGFHLPRNSKAQSNKGEKFSLSHLSNDEKLNFIKQNGVPYKSLIFQSGHIMLYVGIVGENAIILHDVWGLKTLDKQRAIIGKIALTTLEIGKNRPDIPTENLLISKISAMTILE